MKLVEVQWHQMKRFYCSIRVNNVNFTKLSVARLFHSNGPKAAELNFGGDLDQRGRLLKRPFLLWCECTVGRWGL